MVRRQERRPVSNGLAGVPQNIRRPKGDKDQQHTNFNNNDKRICVRRLLDADNQNRGDRGDSEKCYKVENACLVREGGRINTVGGESLGIAADRKSTRLNSSHITISYAVFCLKKKTR